MRTISRVLLIAAGLALAPGLASADWKDNYSNNWKKSHQVHQNQWRGHHYGHPAPWWVKQQYYRHYWYGAPNFRHYYGGWNRHDFRRYDRYDNDRKHDQRPVYRHWSDRDRR